ncbi:MAG: 2-dehydropantoate 2-reductase [Candidatus Omnitrophica bacterium]|nr:2-dehydropantoate 2-reductase [Candidatus Omnitrophota bacterium]
MKIVIVGPGAMGCLFAAFLSKSKEEIWLLDKRKERAALIKEQGIIIEGVSGSWKTAIKISTDAKEIGKADLVIIATKSYDTKEAIAQSRPLIGEKTQILTLQNGIGNTEIISEVLGSDDNIIAGVTNLGATLVKQGHTRHAGKGETIIGRVDAKLPVEMRAIRELFNKTGIEVKFSRDIKSLLWSKLIINAGINALAAITRLNNGKLLDYEGTRKIMREAVVEATKIAKRKRIKLVYDDPLAKVEAVCEATSTNVSSMLQDILNKKRTEIDFINGVIVRLGQEMGIPVFTNTILVNLVKTIEESYKYIIS